MLFAGSQRLQDLFVAAVTAAPAATRPTEAVAGAFEAAAADYFPPVDDSRRRQAVIDAHPGLQERELAKLDNLAAALAEALRSRGVADPAAALVAGAGVAAFKVAFARWLADPADGEFAAHVREGFGGLRAALNGS